MNHLDQHPFDLIISPVVSYLLDVKTFQYQNIKPYIQEELRRYKRDFKTITDHLKKDDKDLANQLEDLKPGAVLWTHPCGRTEVIRYKPISESEFLQKVENYIANLKTVYHTNLYLEQHETLINKELAFYYNMAKKFSKTHWGRWRWMIGIESLFIVGIMRLNETILDSDIKLRKQEILEALRIDAVTTQLSVIEFNSDLKQHIKRRKYRGFEILEHENYFFESFNDLEELVNKVAPLVKDLNINSPIKASDENIGSKTPEISARTVCLLHYYLGNAQEGDPLTNGNLVKFEKLYGFKNKSLDKFVSKVKEYNYRVETKLGTGKGAMRESFQYCLKFFKENDKTESYKLAEKDFEVFKGNN